MMASLQNLSHFLQNDFFLTRPIRKAPIIKIVVLVKKYTRIFYQDMLFNEIFQNQTLKVQICHFLNPEFETQ